MKQAKASLFIHCVGFSLGGQVCGFAGQSGGNIDRISGLDPAGPSFYPDNPLTPDIPEPANANVARLDPGDAPFVDVYHTDSFGGFAALVVRFEPFSVPRRDYKF